MAKRWLHNVRDFFLRHNDLRGVLFFVFLSAVLWTGIKLNKTYEQDLSVPIHYADESGHRLPDSLFGDTLRLTLRASGWQWMLMSRRKPELKVPYRHYTTSQLAKDISTRNSFLRGEIKGEELITNSVRKNYSYIERIPFKWKPEIIPPQGYAVKKLRIIPDTLIVLYRHKPSAVKSPEADRKIFRLKPGDSLITFGWKQRAGRIVLPAKGKILVRLAPYAEAHTRVPVSVDKNLKNKIIIMPVNTDVHYKFWRGAKINNNDWRIVLDSLRPESEKIGLRIAAKPEGVFDVQMRPDSVDYLEMENSPVQ